VRRAQLAEEMGFAGVWVADHFAHLSRPDSTWFDAWTLLGAMALGTSRVRLGPLVSAPAFRNPSLLALQAVTLDHLSAGRLELGLGSGGAPLDFTMTGSAVAEPRERFARFSEMVDVVDALLTTGEVVHRGKHYDLEARVLRPLQQPRPPLVLAAQGPRALRLAAARADCLSTYAAGAAAVETIGQRLQLVEAECIRIGRDPSTLRRSVATFFGLSEPLPSRDEFVAWTKPYRELGVDEFVVYWPSDEHPEKLAALADL
jgi:alkanesulfonate monooxygenase SsuD/methylene tetrahydromethanopterin reductase-like flavin-dependent oxidoreductase (luciferase family)